MRIRPSGSGYAILLDSESATREWMSLDEWDGRPFVSRAKVIGRLDLVERHRAQARTVSYTIGQHTFRVQVIARPTSEGDTVLLRPDPGDARPDPAMFVSHYDERDAFDVAFALEEAGQDVNADWRARVIEYALARPDDVSEALWADLLREETAAASELGGVRDLYVALLRRCVEECRPGLAVDLLSVACAASFDTFMACRQLDLPEPLRERLLGEARATPTRWQSVVELLGSPVGEADVDGGSDWARRVIEAAEAIGASAVSLTPQVDGTLEVHFEVGARGRRWSEGPVPRTARPALTSKLKKLALLDVAEKRAAQRGSFRTAHASGSAVVWDVAVEPTVLGEKLTVAVRREPRERILLACIGECEDNPVHYLRDAYGVDGTLYRIAHRGGWLSVTRLGGENEVLINREHGGPFDSAGSDEDVLAAIADAFELTREGVTCTCGAVYPESLVPMNCHRCRAFLRFPYVVSLATGPDLTVPTVGREDGDMRLAGRYLKDVDASRIHDVVARRDYDRVWELSTELGDTSWILLADGLLVLVARPADEDRARLVDCVSGEGFTDLDAAFEYATSLFGESLRADFALIECAVCRRFRASPDAPCPGCAGVEETEES